MVELTARILVGHVDPNIIKLYTHIADQQSKDAIRKAFPERARHRGGDGADDGSSERAQNMHRKSEGHG